MNKLILVALLALSVVLLVKADGYGDDNDGDDDCGYGDKVDRIDNDLDGAEVSLRSKRSDDDDWYDDKVDRLDNDRDDADVIIRNKRAIRGAYRENSKKKTHSYRQSFKHSMSTDPEGKVSTDTQHHHERNGAQEESNKAGSFGFSNRRDNGWFDTDK